MAKKKSKQKKAKQSKAGGKVTSGKVEKHKGGGKASGSRTKKRIHAKNPRISGKHVQLERQSMRLWKKLSHGRLEKEERSRLLSGMLEKMHGKMYDMGTSQITSRVLQACVKYCQDAERDAIYVELLPYFLTLARNLYGRHLADKLLFHANKDQLHQMICSLRGYSVSFLHHPAGSAVVELAYKLGNSVQKWELLSEFFSSDDRYKGNGTEGSGRIKDILALESPSNKANVLEHMRLCLEPILKQEIVDHSIVHRALVEYLSIATETTVLKIIRQLTGPLLVRMAHTKDGVTLGAMCVTCSNRKEQVEIVKALKGHVRKLARDEYGSVFLLSILSTVDRTRVVNKVVVSELIKELELLVSHKYGQRGLLHLLSPYNPQYFPSDILSIVQSPLRIVDSSGDVPMEELNAAGANSTGGAEDNRACTAIEGSSMSEEEEDDSDDEDGKTDTDPEMRYMKEKDPFQRRLELLQNSGLAKALVDMCTKHAGKLLRSPTGKDVIYEVATGGHANIMWRAVPGGVTSVHEAIVDLAAQSHASISDSGDAEEHVLEQYDSSQVIQLLVKNFLPPPVANKAPSFSALLWDKALKGKCGVWVKGHSMKVISAFCECADPKVKAAAKLEIQPMINSGLLQYTSTVR
eukprot:c27272_g1_i1 orf=692-2596(-)